jgi:futalosine hydrolase
MYHADGTLKPILILSATPEEIAPAVQQMDRCQRLSPYLYAGYFAGKPVEILLGGIGTVSTAFRLTRLLLQRTYSLAVSAGIAGSFADDIHVGDVVQITEDCFADSGIDDNGVFRSLAEAGLADENEYPFVQNWLSGVPVPSPYRNVRGITVQMASGSEKRIGELAGRYQPQIETMENAAFFYVCRMMQMPFVSFRAISNKVEPRNRKNWQVPQAIRQVNAAVIKFLNTNSG